MMDVADTQYLNENIQPQRKNRLETIHEECHPFTLSCFMSFIRNKNNFKMDFPFFEMEYRPFSKTANFSMTRYSIRFLKNTSSGMRSTSSSTVMPLLWEFHILRTIKSDGLSSSKPWQIKQYVKVQARQRRKIRRISHIECNPNHSILLAS